MKPLSERELVATRAIAKQILKKAKTEKWSKLSPDAVSELATREIDQKATETGIDRQWIKSTMMRIQDGRM